MTAIRTPFNRQGSYVSDRYRTTQAPQIASRRAETVSETKSEPSSVFGSLVGEQYASPSQKLAVSPQSEMTSDPELMSAIDEAMSRIDSTPMDDLVGLMTGSGGVPGSVAKGRIGAAGTTAAMGAAVGAPAGAVTQGAISSMFSPVGALASFANRAVPGMVEAPSARRDMTAALNSISMSPDEAQSLFSALENRENLSPVERAALVDRLHALGPEAFNRIGAVRSSAKVDSRPYTSQIGDWAGGTARAIRDVAFGRTMEDKLKGSFGKPEDDDIGPPVGALLSADLAQQARPTMDIGRAFARGLMAVPREIAKLMSEIMTPKEDPMSIFGMSLAESLTSPSAQAYNDRFAGRLEPMFGGGGGGGGGGIGGNSTGSSAPGSDGRGIGSSAREGFSAYGGDEGEGTGGMGDIGF